MMLHTVQLFLLSDSYQVIYLGNHHPQWLPLESTWFVHAQFCRINLGKANLLAINIPSEIL